MPSAQTFEPVGNVAVDSGTVAVVDPAGIKSLHPWIPPLRPNVSAEPLTNLYGMDVGVKVATTIGDGSYPVFLVKDNGHVQGLYVQFA